MKKKKTNLIKYKANNNIKWFILFGIVATLLFSIIYDILIKSDLFIVYQIIIFNYLKFRIIMSILIFFIIETPLIFIFTIRKTKYHIIINRVLLLLIFQSIWIIIGFNSIPDMIFQCIFTVPLSIFLIFGYLIRYKLNKIL